MRSIVTVRVLNLSRFTINLIFDFRNFVIPKIDRDQGSDYSRAFGASHRASSPPVGSPDHLHRVDSQPAVQILGPAVRQLRAGGGEAVQGCGEHVLGRGSLSGAICFCQFVFVKLVALF